MERYQVGDEVEVLGRGRGQILAVAQPGIAIEQICEPLMPHLARLSLQGKRFTWPAPHDEQRFTGPITRYLVESDAGLIWVGWHLARRLRRSIGRAAIPFMVWPEHAPGVDAREPALAA